MIKENLYNMSKKADFIEKTIENELTEREQLKHKKMQEYNLKMKLQKHFYNYFKKYQGNTEKDLIDFYDIDIREKIIQELGENDGKKMTYLNKIYSKTLKEISEIFINNDKFLESQKPRKSFAEACAEATALFEECQHNAPKSKKDKNGFLLFLNLILGNGKK